jgi:cell division protein FtsZ
MPAAKPIAEESVSEVIRETERDMAAFEEKTAAAPAASSPDFRPQSKLCSPEPSSRCAPRRRPDRPRRRAQPAAATAAEESPRMPRVEDFPPIVQAEVESHGARPAHAEEEDERGPLGLLKRLTHGLSREEKPAHGNKLRPAEPGIEQRGIRAAPPVVAGRPALRAAQGTAGRSRHGRRSHGSGFRRGRSAGDSGLPAPAGELRLANCNRMKQKGRVIAAFCLVC